MVVFILSCLWIALLSFLLGLFVQKRYGQKIETVIADAKQIIQVVDPNLNKQIAEMSAYIDILKRKYNL